MGKHYVVAREFIRRLCDVAGGEKLPLMYIKMIDLPAERITKVYGKYGVKTSTAAAIASFDPELNEETGWDIQSGGMQGEIVGISATRMLGHMAPCIHVRRID